jgi:hypothetical protein
MVKYITIPGFKFYEKNNIKWSSIDSSLFHNNRCE